MFAILDGEPSEIYRYVVENISKLKDYVNSKTVKMYPPSSNPQRENSCHRKQLRDSAEDIPRIIIQDANEGWRIPGAEYQHSIGEPDIWRSNND